MSVDLRTRYLGLELRSPIVASAALRQRRHGPRRPPGGGRRRGVVLPSLFEEQVVHEQVGLSAALDDGTGQFAEASGYFPDDRPAHRRRRALPTAIQRIKDGTSVPIIGSLNASTRRGWVRYARLIQDAGADALELNLYRVACDPGRSAAAVERPTSTSSRPCASRSPSRSPSSSRRTTRRSPGSPTRRCAPGPTAWSCSTASTSRTSTWRPWRSCRGST